MKPRLLDLFCKAGGAAKGYADAGFAVVGVDIEPQPHYPYEFIQADAMVLLSRWKFEGALRNIAAIHASPPCQRYSTMTKRWGRENEHPDLIDPLRYELEEIGLPYVIENVPGAPLRNPLTLCGSMFGLNVRRHRNFESNVSLVRFGVPVCRHEQQGKIVGVYGHAGGRSVRDGLTFGGVATWREAMQIDWMTGNELAEAIPPAYTRHIGRALIEGAAR